MKTIRKLLILAGLVAIVALGIAYFSLNAIVKRGFEAAGGSVTKVETRLGSASILPFAGSGTLNDIFIGNPEGFKTPYAIQVNSVKVGVDLPSIKSDTVVIDRVTIQTPDIYIEGGLTGKNNLTAIAGNLESSPKQPKQQKNGEANKPSGPESAKVPAKKVIIKELRITGAKVRWVSSLTLGQEVFLPLPEITLANIGEEKHGTTAADLYRLIMREIFKAASTVSNTDAIKAAGQLKETGAKGLDKATSGLKGLLQK